MSPAVKATRSAILDSVVLSFHITVLQLGDISHQVQQFLLTAQALLSTKCGSTTTLSLSVFSSCFFSLFFFFFKWPAARSAPRINVNSRAAPVMDASSDVLTTLFAVS